MFIDLEDGLRLEEAYHAGGRRTAPPPTKKEPLA